MISNHYYLLILIDLGVAEGQQPPPKKRRIISSPSPSRRSPPSSAEDFEILDLLSRDVRYSSWSEHFMEASVHKALAARKVFNSNTGITTNHNPVTFWLWFGNSQRDCAESMYSISIR